MVGEGEGKWWVRGGEMVGEGRGGEMVGEGRGNGG